MEDRNTTSTMAGGGAMLAMLADVHWDKIADGEVIKIGVAIALGLLGYCAYRKEGKEEKE